MTGTAVKTIIESELVAKRIDKATEEAPRLHEAYNGLKWKLARNATSAVNVVRVIDDWYLAKTALWGPGGLPSITVVYRVTTNEVFIELSRINWPKNRKKK